LQVAIVIHANHANELDELVATNLKQLRDNGAILLNQSVLLRGINDTVQALESLSKRLFECGVLPYYLHLLDRVDGAAHFEVPHKEAAALMQALSSRLSGYLVPRLVREDAGAPSKTLLPW
jgi:L-lysine 2,3-aminomutase